MRSLTGVITEKLSSGSCPSCPIWMAMTERTRKPPTQMWRWMVWTKRKRMKVGRLGIL